MRLMEQKFAFLDAVIEGIPNMIFIKDARDLRFVRFNKAGEELIGYSRDLLIGKSDYDLFPEADADHFTRVDREVLASRRALDIPEEILHKRDGTICFLHTKKIGLYDERGVPAFLVGISEDITERKRLEEERIDLLARERSARLEAEHMAQLRDQERVQRLEAERLNRIKDEFLATLSHELRTPLHAVIGWTSLLIEGALSAAEVPKALATIERNARAEAQLVNDLLDVSGIVTGHFEMERGTVDPVVTMRAAIEVSRIAATNKDIRVDFEIEGAPFAVIGDAHRLQQVFWNLLSNAIKFTPKGGHVTVSIRRSGSDVAIAVKDTGIGIGPEFLPYIFDRFRQADSSVTRHFGGLGLGLSIVRHLTELHGGHVVAESEGVGRGATLKVTLPLAPQMKVDIQASIDRTTPGQLASRRVLIVDDHDDTRELLRSILAREGAIVVEAASAAEARVQLGQQALDVMISDVGMPEEDGLQFIRSVRKMGGAESQLLSMALTAYASEYDRRLAIDSGFDDYLAKPVKPGELISRLVRLLHKQVAPSAADAPVP